VSLPAISRTQTVPYRIEDWRNALAGAVEDPISEQLNGC
jgi:hypothetical protein